MSYAQKMRLNRVESPGSGKPGELALLAQIRARAAGTPDSTLRLGIGDDCALLRLRPGEELAVTTDLSIAGRHFRLDWHTPEAIGHRTLARGLSDLAAMGARPVAAFLSLGLPGYLVKNPKGPKFGMETARATLTSTWSGAWIDRFLDGFLALAEAYQTPLAGGDLAESPLPVADIVLTGAVRRGKALLRSGARPGDLLYVTGSLGGAAAGLALLANAARRSKPARQNRPARPFQVPVISANLAVQLAAHLFPQPRIAQGLCLARRSLATAAIDLSDGLSTDLAHLCDESGVAAEVNAAALPIHTAATLAQAVHGGEDYELLFTARPSARVPRSIAGVPVTCIGLMIRKSRVTPQVTLIRTRGSQPLAPRGWQHFS
jgi:thiamine-monophosphate kinase